ncbi:hypothetical protein K470DRAFT_279115 [Piedraia hortae CBS 480.64]|uniref:Cryptic loci regulator 2 N-terminal domain-containing protein n=1 Tax=Piedraia hortae CBS 480.64 TaxID=1314780 RepID=A0A6A7BR08_9PEZI|nr:hypothetical protein K470DRAFT_279115 [Piedraia hortae CBS 480.64]
MPLRLKLITTDASSTFIVGTEERENIPPESLIVSSKPERPKTNYYRRLPLDDPRSIYWRKELATRFVREQHLSNSNNPSSGCPTSSVPSSNRRASTNSVSNPSTATHPPSTGLASTHQSVTLPKFILTDFPPGYTLWEYVTVANGKHRVRKDFYLYGHPHGVSRRYKSPNHFLPHLCWLSKGMVGKCGCLPCNGRY